MYVTRRAQLLHISATLVGEGWFTGYISRFVLTFEGRRVFDPPPDFTEKSKFQLVFVFSFFLERGGGSI